MNSLTCFVFNLFKGEDLLQRQIDFSVSSGGGITGFPWTLAGPELLCLFILAEAEVRDVVMCQVWETHHNSELHRESLSLARLAGIIISVKK